LRSETTALVTRLLQEPFLFGIEPAAEPGSS
jgi:hypothetical protein